MRIETKEITSPFGGRRSDRILWPVPIYVTGTDHSGAPFVEEAVTISINKHGARISLTNSLLPGDLILIRNPRNGIEEEFRVIPGYQQVFGDRHEWRVEAINPDSKIWGIEFNQPAEEIQPKVLIECWTCKNMTHRSLTSIEYGVLLSIGMISYHCSQCGETTRWKPSARSAGAHGPPRNANPARSGGAVRKVRRVEMTMSVHVRNSRGVKDMPQTRDVSKGGLSFVSSLDFQVGDVVFIAFPFVDRKSPAEARGKILWTAQSLSGRLHGVAYVDAA